MKEIGGYFQLDLNKNLEYHPNAIKLNIARNALEYILIVRKYKKIYIPFFTCDVILEPLKKLNIEYEFYNIDVQFEPVFNYNNIKENEGFLYTNYFGLKDIFVNELSKLVTNLIIDNAQSFFSKPIENIDTFYSPRKFFGVPDGGYLYCNKLINYKLAIDISIARMEHILIRLETNASNGYTKFCSNESALKNQPIMEMSNITKKILDSIDYNEAEFKRIENFHYLHNHLKKNNLLKIELDKVCVPMVYPYWCKDKNLKKLLIENNIYTATYWNNVINWCAEETLEYKFSKEVIYLPIDQRYGIEDMARIINILN